MEKTSSPSEHASCCSVSCPSVCFLLFGWIVWRFSPSSYSRDSVSPRDFPGASRRIDLVTNKPPPISPRPACLVLFAVAGGLPASRHDDVVYGLLTSPGLDAGLLRLTQTTGEWAKVSP